MHWEIELEADPPPWALVLQTTPFTRGWFVRLNLMYLLARHCACTASLPHLFQLSALYGPQSDDWTIERLPDCNNFPHLACMLLGHHLSFCTTLSGCSIAQFKLYCRWESHFTLHNSLLPSSAIKTHLYPILGPHRNVHRWISLSPWFSCYSIRIIVAVFNRACHVGAVVQCSLAGSLVLWGLLAIFMNASGYSFSCKILLKCSSSICTLPPWAMVLAR